MPPRRPIETIRLKRAVLSDDYLLSQKGTYFDERYCTTLIGGRNVDVLKPDGSVLLKLRAKAIRSEHCELARPALRHAGSKWSENRQLLSGLMGYYENTRTIEAGAIPTCRATAYTSAELDGWLSVQPFIRAANSVFARHFPQRYIAQRKLALRTPPDWVIGRTAFTTMTVNLWDGEHGARTSLHQDAGDLPEGFGVLSTLTKGTYEGGWLLFPRWGVGVDMRTCDVLLADVHEWHANAPIVADGPFERIACIFYFRTAMSRCE